MKRSHHVLVAFACAVALGGGPSSMAQPKKTVIGIGQPNVEHPYRVGGINKAKEWAAKHPEVELVIADGRRNSAVQLSGLEDLLVRGVDVLIISPNDSNALTAIAGQAKGKKVPLVVFDRRLNVPPSDYAAYIGADNVAMGRVAGEYLAKAIGGKGTIIQLEGTQGASATTDRKKGFEEVIKKFPDIKVVSYVGEYRTAEAVKSMEDGVVAHPAVAAVYAHNDTMAIAGAQVLAERGKKNVPVIGMDGAKEGCDGIKDNKITGSVYYPTMFPDALEIAMKVLRGESVPKETMLETPLITKDNWSNYCQ